MRYAMIMAGGVGSRLWPMSRRAHPKQLLPFIGGRSLLEIASERVHDLVDPSRQFVCIAESLRPAVREVLPSVADDRILGEPMSRNTMNAVGFTAAVLRATDPEAVFAVLTADHIIEPAAEFAAKMDVGFRLVEDDPSRFVTFSIKPTWPATGYGYVERDRPIEGFESAFTARRFHEKPDEPTAEAYVADEKVGWNSGMFVFRASTVLDAIGKYHPEAHERLLRIGAAWGTSRRAIVLNEVYPKLPEVSIDVGVMEPASAGDDFHVCTVEMGVRWTDVGSWPSFGETLRADERGNATAGTAMHLDSSNVLVVSDDPNHVIATIGCKDLIVVRTDDVTLIVPRDRAQEVGDMAKSAPERLR